MKKKEVQDVYDVGELKAEVSVISDEEFEALFQNIGEEGMRPSVLGDESKIKKSAQVKSESKSNAKASSKALKSKVVNTSKSASTKTATKSSSVKNEKVEDKASHIFKNIKVKRGIDGLGLFADEEIKKGEKIIEYIGNILLGELEADSKTNMYLFEVNKNKTIDGSPRWNTARYINHSCKGNAESEIQKGRVYVVATKTIKEGEEITYDYGEEFFKEYIKPKGCRCGAPKHKYSK